MKNKLKYLESYIPWLIILLLFDLFIWIILWISDERIFKALFLFLFLATVIFFSIIVFVLIEKESKKEIAYKSFILNPDKNTERELLKLCNSKERENIKLIARAFYERQEEIEKVNSLLSEYEEYVEIWAHEIKLPISLLSLVLDNENDKLPKDIAFKLDYVRNQIQENISQILFYYRIKSDRKDFLFEDVDLKESIVDVLENFKPLLEEKHFKINMKDINGTIYTDYRSFEFILSQIIANSIKYSNENPELTISMKKENNKNILSIKDNGCGVKSCDLNHLFEKGFTGDSGDMRKKSTGMGLYLVKQLAYDLKIDIEVKSKWMKGFEIELFFK